MFNRSKIANIAKNLNKLNQITTKLQQQQPHKSFSLYVRLQSGDIKKFTDKHEWISVSKNNVGTVGITDYAQDKLGEVVYVELPKKDAKFDKGASFSTLESVKAVSECYMPVSGTVVEVNSALSEAPSTINKKPFTDGWLVKINVTNKSELDSLMSEAQYKEYLKTADNH